MEVLDWDTPCILYEEITTRPYSETPKTLISIKRFFELGFDIHYLSFLLDKGEDCELIGGNRIAYIKWRPTGPSPIGEEGCYTSE